MTARITSAFALLFVAWLLIANESLPLWTVAPGFAALAVGAWLIWLEYVDSREGQS